MYALALAVYCSSWTFYGAVGTAVRSGVSYLPIYVGPILLMLFGADAEGQGVRAGFSPDGTLAYYADTPTGRIDVFDNVDDRLGQRRARGPQHLLQGGQGEQHRVRTCVVAHRADAPDLAVQGSEAGAGAGAGASIYLSFGLVGAGAGAGADTFILNLGSDSGANVIIYGHLVPVPM